MSTLTSHLLVLLTLLPLSLCPQSARSQTQAPANAAALQPPKPGSLLAGPYLLVDPRPGFAVFRWEVVGEAEGTIVLTASDGTQQRAEGLLEPAETLTVHLPGRVYRAEFSGLAACGTYSYTLEPAMDGQQHSFQMPPASGELCDGRLRIGILGDTRFHDTRHAAVARQLADQHPQLAVNLGDIVNTARSVDEWPRFFRTAAPLVQSAPIVVVPGNHEAYKDPPFGAAMMNRYFRVASREGVGHWSYTLGPVHLIFLDLYWGSPMGGKGKVWLEQQLQSVPKGYHIIVAVHEPAYSFSRHRVTRAMKGLRPLFAKYKVDLVCAGHAHVYEHFEADGVTYLTVGGGGASFHKPRMNPVASEERFYKGGSAFHHYLVIELDSKRITFTVVNTDKKAVHETWSQPRK